MMPPRIDGRYAKARQALAPYRILGTPPEPAFDIFTGLVRTALGVPDALLAFFDGELVCFKATAGAAYRHPGIVARVRDVFAFERAIVSSDGARLFCGAPIATPGGQTVGAIAGIALDDRPASPGMDAAIVTIAAAVTQALDTRRNVETTSAQPSHALIAFDAADLSVVFADMETMRARGATREQIQALTFDDIFTGMDVSARHDIDLLRDAPRDEPFAFSARVLGTIGFWLPVACTVRAIRERRVRTLIVVECAPPAAAPARSNLHVVPSPAARATLHEHRIDAVLSKIEAGRRALREEESANGLPLTVDDLARAAAQLLADTDDAHVLAVFCAEPHALRAAIERARRTRLLCDHDLVAVVDDAHIAMLLRDMPVAIGTQAVKRFVRTVPGLQFAVRNARGPAASIRALLDDAVAELHP